MEFFDGGCLCGDDIVQDSECSENHAGHEEVSEIEIFEWATLEEIDIFSGGAGEMAQICEEICCDDSDCDADEHADDTDVSSFFDAVGDVEGGGDDDTGDCGDEERISSCEDRGDNAVYQDQYCDDESEECADCFLFSDDDAYCKKDDDAPEKTY